MRSATRKILILSAVLIPGLVLLGMGPGSGDPAARAGKHQAATFYVA